MGDDLSHFIDQRKEGISFAHSGIGPTIGLDFGNVFASPSGSILQPHESPESV